jgi:hypothetical protein
LIKIFRNKKIKEIKRILDIEHERNIEKIIISVDLVGNKLYNIVL